MAVGMVLAVGLEREMERVMAERKSEQATAVVESPAQPVAAPSVAELEAQLKEAQKALAEAKQAGARRGMYAVTGAPTRDDLPEVKAGLKSKTGDVIDAWIAELLRAGFKAEAGAVGNLYNRLVRHNLISVPENAELLK